MEEITKGMGNVEGKVEEIMKGKGWKCVEGGGVEMTKGKACVDE